MDAVRVSVAPPSTWTATTVEPPPVAESAGARLVAWSAWHDERDEAVLLTGCVATTIPGWVEDMRPPAFARTVALAGAATAKIVGGPVDARTADDGSFVLRLASNLEGPAVGRARPFVGFDASRVFTCFATCSLRTPPKSPVSVSCDGAVLAARLEGDRGPPPPGLPLRAGTWAVHHPRPVAWFGAALVVVVSCFVVAFRRRPRSRAWRRVTKRAD